MTFINFAEVNGRLLVTEADVVGPLEFAGFLYDPATRAMLIKDTFAIARHLNGIPFTADGRVVCSKANGAATSWNSGLAYNALGQLEMTETNPIARYVGGWPVDAEGRICIYAYAPLNPPGDFNFTSAATTGVGSQDVKLDWTSSSNSANYLIYRNGVLVATPTALTYTDVHPGVGTWTYDLSAYNSTATTLATPPSRQVTVVSTSVYRITATADRRITSTGDLRIAA
jgi:hypothetical protein